MAFTYTEAQSISEAYYDTPLVQQVYQDSPFYQRMKQKNQIVIGGGLNIRFPIRYEALGYANAVDSEAQVVFEQKATRNVGVLEWTTYIGKTKCSWKERIQNTGKTQIVDIMAEKATEMREDIDNRFATDLYTTNPNGFGFASLPVIVNSTGAYAGLVYTDAATWKAYKQDDATTILALFGTGSISEAIADCVFGKHFPNFFLTTIDLASKVESLIEPQKRYYDKNMADIGFRSISLHGYPVTGDYHCPAKAFYGLCDNTFKIHVHKDYNMKLSKWEPLFQAGFPHDLGRIISWSGNIVCNCRRPNFKFTVLDYTL